MNVAVCLKRVFISSIHRMMRARARSFNATRSTWPLHSKPIHIRISIYNWALSMGHVKRQLSISLSLRTNSHGWLLCCAFSHLLFFPVRLFFSITFHISFVSHIASHRIASWFAISTHTYPTVIAPLLGTPSLSSQQSHISSLLSRSLSLSRFHRCATHFARIRSK